jgi:hypothetical protein
MIRWECKSMKLNNEDKEVPVQYNMMMGDLHVGTVKAVRAWGGVGWYGDVHLPTPPLHATTSIVQKDLEQVKTWVTRGVANCVEEMFKELREEGCL